VANDSAVAQPTTIPFTSLVRAPEPSGDTPPRHIPLSTSLRALPCVPSGLVVCAGLPEPCPTATGGSGFTIEIGSDFVIGPKGKIIAEMNRVIAGHRLADSGLEHAKKMLGVVAEIEQLRNRGEAKDR
jgi:hypothetical protein